MLSDLRQVLRLHRVDIYFATPTFDEITKDLKASFMLKISTIGGGRDRFKNILDRPGIDGPMFDDL